MSIRSALLLASAATLGFTAPAAAQDDRYAGIEDYQGAWEGEWVSDDTYRGEWAGTYRQSDSHAVAGDEHGRRFAYTEAERNQWLSDCQFLMADAGGFDDDDDGVDGTLLGGLIGAIGGGIIGNRVAGDDRLLGTVIGAGVGGLAGTAIGSILDSDGDGEYSRNEVWAARYCDAYLRRHELGGGEFAYGQQVVLVPASRSVRRGCGSCGTSVVTEEEWIEVEETVQRPRRRVRQVARPAPAPAPRGKRTPAD